MSRMSLSRHWTVELFLVVALLTAGAIVKASRGSSTSRYINSTSREEKAGARAAKFLLPLFEVVQFQNTECESASSANNGTCYTSGECSERGGQASGTCAEGFGVCCIISISCGSTSYENNTVLSEGGSSASTIDSPCTYTICPRDDDICRIKLDLRTFDIGGPFGGTAIDSTTVIPESTAATRMGHCVTDYLFVRTPGKSQSVPMICGYNTGQHIILDPISAPDCHEITFVTTSSASSIQWDINVIQYKCGRESDDLAGPTGCLQFHIGSTGVIQNYAYPTTATTSTTHLANQNYDICIRTELGNCQICYTAINFGLSVSPAAIVMSSSADPTTTFCSTDYIWIPLANTPAILTTAITGVFPAAAPGYMNKFCGRFFNKEAIASSATMCSNVNDPFRVKFVTDDGEMAPATPAVNVGNLDELVDVPGGIIGFQLSYTQNACM